MSSATAYNITYSHPAAGQQAKCSESSIIILTFLYFALCMVFKIISFHYKSVCCIWRYAQCHAMNESETKFTVGYYEVHRQCYVVMGEVVS